MRAPLLTSLLLLSVASCSRGPIAEVATPVVQAPPPVAQAMPVPPSGAAANLAMPARLADGSYATPNRNLSEAATIWHLRSALNVAVLACPDGAALAASYNQLLRIHREPLKRAHAGLAAEAGTSLDAAMTRVYNYFSQPPVQRDFCPAATVVLAEAAATPASDFASFACNALPRLDAPFIAFYHAYDAYRADLALWRTGDATPQIAYDGRAFLGDNSLAGGRPAQIATR